MDKIPIIAVVGPTASGKTNLAIKLANYFSCPIINADAFQIYKDMNIGTGKISSSSDDYKKHYLLDIRTPEETYSVKDYQDDFRRTLNELLKTNENVIICGGTGLYLKAGLFDFSFPDEAPADVSDLEKLDNETLYQMLKELDPKATETIHINNRKRVIRALEYYKETGEAISKHNEEESQKSSPYNFAFFVINDNRDILYERINTNPHYITLSHFFLSLVGEWRQKAAHLPK